MNTHIAITFTDGSQGAWLEVGYASLHELRQDIERISHKQIAVIEFATWKAAL